MNVPNVLTILRLAIAAVFVYVFQANILAAAMLFILASVTDYFDGYLARKYHQETSFGKIMDPIADKFLILAAFAMFAYIRIVFWWMFWAIAIREVAVTLFRFWAMSKGQILAAEKAGKAKTVFQMATIIMLFISVILYPDIFLGKICLAAVPINIITLVAFDIILLFLSVVVTVLSGISVFWNNRALISTNKGKKL